MGGARAIRRAARRRIIVRRTAWLVQGTGDNLFSWVRDEDGWTVPRYPAYPDHPGRFAKYNPGICCPYHQIDGPRSFVVGRWDGSLDVDGTPTCDADPRRASFVRGGL